MATYEKGVLGSFNGLVGTVVGSSWKGMNIMRSRNKKSSKKPTLKQLMQQARFAFLIRFISPLAGLLEKTFDARGVEKTSMNLAFQYNYNNALTGTYPAYGLDYSKVLISRGSLLNANSPAAVAAANGRIDFSWTDNSGLAQANATDKAILVAHCADLNQAVFITNGAPRTAGTDSLDASIFSGRTVQTWLAFINAEGTEVASSIYTGPVVIS